MVVKRVISEKQREKLINSKEHKGKNPELLTRKELDELIVILAKKAGIL